MFVFLLFLKSFIFLLFLFAFVYFKSGLLGSPVTLPCVYWKVTFWI